jgi:hypothetical protein
MVELERCQATRVAAVLALTSVLADERFLPLAAAFALIAKE